MSDQPVRPHGDAHRFYATLVALTGRKLPMAEVYDALGVSKASYYRLHREGMPAERLIAAAARLGINPIELLVTYHPELRADAMDYAAKVLGDYWQMRNHFGPCSS